jgi:hypothetical protein
MVKRVTFVSKRNKLTDIHNHYVDCEAALKHYLNLNTIDDTDRYFGMSEIELRELRELRVGELNSTSSFSLLAEIEALFRVDYLYRNYEKLKDPISREMRALYSVKDVRAALVEDIISTWQVNTIGSSKLFEDLKGALKYRHWLAHGRYWAPKMARQRYDYRSIYELTEQVNESLPLVVVSV